LSKYRREATYRDGLLVLNNIRPEDKAEVEGMGLEPLHVPFGVLACDHPTYFHVDEKPAGIAGIVRLSPTEGQVWMLCTPLIAEVPHTFVREAKRCMRSVEGEYQLLWNYADARNHVHHKLLKHLGFKALREVPCGPYQLPYLEIVKLCVQE